MYGYRIERTLIGEAKLNFGKFSLIEHLEDET